jgi:predicted nuclease of predicted toxin-antitoxin system
LDQNLSFRLLPALALAFPGSKHVKDCGLSRADDEEIWRFAADNGFVIVSKDGDFVHRALLRGHPPKFVHLRAGNCRSSTIREVLIANRAVMECFFADPEESLLVLEQGIRCT